MTTGHFAKTTGELATNKELDIMSELAVIDLPNTTTHSPTDNPLPSPNQETAPESTSEQPDPISATTAPQESTTPPPTQPIDEAQDEEEDGNLESRITMSLEHDSLTYEQATISVHLQLLPEDNHPEGRPIIIGVRSHNLPPLMQTYRAGALMPLPNALEQLLAKWKEHYPTALGARDRSREEERRQAQAKVEKRKTEAERRKTELKSQQAAKKHKPKVTKPSTPTNTPPPPTSVAAAQVPQSTLF